MGYWSNCFVEFWREYRKRHREWRDLGMPEGKEPYRVKRNSRHMPRRIPHYLLGSWKDCDKCGGGIHVESFKPIDPKPVPFWKSPTRLLFKGHWVHGDAHKEIQDSKQ